MSPMDPSQVAPPPSWGWGKVGPGGRNGVSSLISFHMLPKGSGGNVSGNARTKCGLTIPEAASSRVYSNPGGSEYCPACARAVVAGRN